MSIVSFGYTGSNATYTVPAGVVGLTVSLWGAGGGYNGYYGAGAGAGAYLNGVLTVTPGQTLTIVSGAGGELYSANGFGGGGGSYATGGNQWNVGNGGGASSVRSRLIGAITSASSTASSLTYTTTIEHNLVLNQPVTITGMGTAAYNLTALVATIPSPTTFTVASTAAPASVSAQTGTLDAVLVIVGGGGGGAGGAVGGAASYNGTAVAGTTNGGAGGGGGSTSAGGAAGGAGATAGSLLQGGTGANGFYSGGGGGGYYGGGGGSNGAGGGGSSYYSSYFRFVTGANNTDKYGASVGTSDPAYNAALAPGATQEYSNTTKGNGFVALTPVPPTCFTAEANLLTPSGYKSAADIHTGDLLMTADGRKVPVKAYKATIMGTEFTAPFLVPKNALGMGCPKADLRLSPWHAIQMNNGLWMKPKSFSELVPGSVEQYDIGKPVTYYHFEAPNFFKDNLVCDGTVVESYGADQLENIKGRVYTYNAKLGGYTRISGKSVAGKKVLM